jgi:hypothetical protein
MTKISVVHVNSKGEEQSDQLEAHSWTVENGVLYVHDAEGYSVATYAAGNWLNVTKEN